MSLAFVRGIHWWPVKCPHKGPVMWQMFPFVDVIMMKNYFYITKLIISFIVVVFNCVKILKNYSYVNTCCQGELQFAIVILLRHYLIILIWFWFFSRSTYCLERGYTIIRQHLPSYLYWILSPQLFLPLTKAPSINLSGHHIIIIGYFSAGFSCQLSMGSTA